MDSVIQLLESKGFHAMPNCTNDKLYTINPQYLKIYYPNHYKKSGYILILTKRCELLTHYTEINTEFKLMLKLQEMERFSL